MKLSVIILDKFPVAYLGPYYKKTYVMKIIKKRKVVWACGESKGTMANTILTNYNLQLVRLIITINM